MMPYSERFKDSRTDRFLCNREERQADARARAHDIDAESLIEARAAVAELVAAAQDYKWLTQGAYGIVEMAAGTARLNAALAKFGGAA